MTVTYGGDKRRDTSAAVESRAVWPAIRRGIAGRCPHCGKGRLFSGFLAVSDRCEACGEDLHHHRADDFPPYATIFIVGHLVVPAMYYVEKVYRPELWVHSAIWLPLTIVLAVLLIRPIKGAIVGLQWALRMHGFGPDEAEDGPVPEPAPAAARIDRVP